MQVGFGFFVTLLTISFSGPAPLIPAGFEFQHKNISLVQGDAPDCSKLVVTLTSKKDKIHVPEGCDDYGFDAGDADCGGATTFPMECTFKLEHSPNLQSSSMFVEEKAIKKEASLSEIYSRLSKKGKTVGKHDAQYAWAAKAMAKATMSGDKCKPATIGRRYRTVDCDMCWLGPFPHPCNCDCRGWKDNLPGLCNEPCTGEYADYDATFCHKPCDREGQMALHYGCGFFHDRVCVESTGACIGRWVSRAWALMDILLFIGTAGVGKSMKAAVELGAEIGLKATMKLLKKTMKDAVKKLVKKVSSNSWIKKQLKDQSEDMKDRILENGANMYLSANIPTDWGKVALEIAAAVDPTGVVGFAKEFIPPEGCDEIAYFKDPYPADRNGPDWDALEADRFDAGADEWAQEGGDNEKCENTGNAEHEATSQLDCQFDAITAGSNWYSFAAKEKRCFHSTTCDSVITGTGYEWKRFFSDPWAQEGGDNEKCENNHWSEHRVANKLDCQSGAISAGSNWYSFTAQESRCFHSTTCDSVISNTGYDWKRFFSGTEASEDPWAQRGKGHEKCDENSWNEHKVDNKLDCQLEAINAGADWYSFSASESLCFHSKTCDSVITSTGYDWARFSSV